MTDINLTPGVEFTSLLVSVIDTNTGTTVFGPTEAIGTTGVFDISSISPSIRTLRLQIDESPVNTVAWDDNVPPKGSLTFTNNTPVQFCYQTTVTCASNTQKHTNTINTTLDPKIATAEVSTCAPSPNLTITKSTPSPSLVVGQNSTYTLTVTNSGGANATTATVKDALPIGLDLISATDTGWTCVPSSGSSPVGTITCNFSGTITANGGTSTINLVTRPTAAQGGTTVINYASVDPAGGMNPPTPTNCTAANTPAGCAAPVSSNIPASPNLAVSKSQPSPSLVVGQNSTYTITVTNNGGANATTATVKDALPVGLDLISATGTNWACIPSSATSPVGTITCTFSGGTITANGGTSTINLVVNPAASLGGTSVTNKVAVDPTGGTSPPTPSNCTAANSAGCGTPVTTSIPAGPNLAVSKSQPSPPLIVGQNSTYTITVTNNGGANATTATVKDAIPAGMNLTSATGANWACVPTMGTGPTTVTCTFSGSSIGANGGTSTISLGVTLTATNLANITNKVSVDPTGGKNAPDPTTCIAANTPSAGCSAPVTTVLYSAPNLTVAAGGQPLGAIITDPAVCLDPSGLVGITATVTNPNPGALAVNLHGYSAGGSDGGRRTCTLSWIRRMRIRVACTIAANGGSVSWNGMLHAGHNRNIIYRARIGAAVAQGTQLCIQQSRRQRAECNESAALTASA